MHYLLSFCMTMASSDGHRIPANRGFVVGDGAKVGDLVRLSAAPASKWQIGWLVAIDDTNPHYRRWLIESLEDGETCWWLNVGVDYLERDSVGPQWRWTDRQWQFQRRWFRVCYHDCDAHIAVPLYPVFPGFGEGFEVTLGLRTKFGLDDYRPTRTFPDWRKVTRAMMAQCYRDCDAERETLREQAKAAAG